jgi:hypothetical protein
MGRFMRPMMERAQAMAPDFGGMFFDIVGFTFPFWKSCSI